MWFRGGGNERGTTQRDLCVSYNTCTLSSPSLIHHCHSLSLFPSLFSYKNVYMTCIHDCTEYLQNIVSEPSHNYASDIHMASVKNYL